MIFEQNSTYRLATHVWIRAESGKAILETALSGERLAISSPAIVHLILAFRQPLAVQQVLAQVEPKHQAAVLQLIERLHATGMLTRIRDDGTAEEDQGPLATWEFHDLLFHTRSRVGRHRYPIGATFRFKGIQPQAPAVRPASGAAQLQLPTPDTTLSGNEMSLTTALAIRQTTYRTTPFDLLTLSTFLFHTLRICAVRNLGESGEVLRKVYPGGGGIHSLEAYAIIARCSGVTPGMYRYRPQEHSLEWICDLSTDVEQLLIAAQATAGSPPPAECPPVLFVIASRFHRMAWKYQAIAYRLMLIELGALIQTMYLVGTAMGLSPSAIGSGNSDLFARVAGVDYYEETSVGEFILGGRP